MDLVEIGNYISNLESRNIDEIKKLRLLGFNIWKLYRNFYCGVLQEKSHNKRVQYVNKSINTILQFVKSSENSVFIRVTSSSFNERTGTSFKSRKLDVIKRCIEETGANCKVLGTVYTDKYMKMYPKVDLVLDSFVGFFSNKLRYLMLVPLLFNSIKHFVLLNHIRRIPFKFIWNSQANFLAKYCLFYLFYRLSKPKAVLLLFSSYGSEPEIAALKKNGIKVLEYQHGHLYPEHYGYNYNKSLSSIKKYMLLPDGLLVYGDYWKEVLLSIQFFDDSDIQVAGNPSFENVQEVVIDSFKKSVVLVCSQPNSSHMFIEFIENYMTNSEHKNEVYWVVKLHPRENVADWENFVSNKGYIELSDQDTYSLMKSIPIQLVGASTTMYEALYFGVSNYIILNDLKINMSQNYEKSIGKIIDLNWLDKFIKFNNSNDKKYFSKFNPDFIKQA